MSAIASVPPGRTAERALKAAQALIKLIPRQQATPNSPRVALNGTVLEIVNPYGTTQSAPVPDTFLRRKAAGVSLSDFFAGCGGVSLGALWAGIGDIRAYNHWPEAVAAHALNIPGHHFVADLLTVKEMVGRGYTSGEDGSSVELFSATDLLWNSAPCRFHTGAKTAGKVSKSDTRTDSERDEEAKRTRRSMYSGLEYAKVHRPKVVITENVEDIHTKWDELPQWKQGWQDAGYVTIALHLNSAFFGEGDRRVPAWRDRVYWAHVAQEVAHLADFTFTPEAECTSCHRTVNAVQQWKNGRTWGKYKTQYIYVCPRCTEQVHPMTRGLDAALDVFEDPGTPISERSLGHTTLTRLQNGLDNLIAAGLPAQPLVVVQDRSDQPDIKPAKPWTVTGPTLTGRQVLGVATHPDLMTGSTKPASSLPKATELSFRMLSPRELSTIAGLPRDYVWAGSKRDTALATGNMVSPSVAQWFMERSLAVL